MLDLAALQALYERATATRDTFVWDDFHEDLVNAWPAIHAELTKLRAADEINGQALAAQYRQISAARQLLREVVAADTIQQWEALLERIDAWDGRNEA